jgi:regulatory protein
VFVTLDDGSTLEMAPESVPAGLPEPGEGVSEQLLADLGLAAERKKVARLVFAVLDRRLQPVARIRAKALDKGFKPEAVDAVLEQMADRGLYSDRHFAEAYCRDALARTPVGRRYLVGKLTRLQVPSGVANQVAGEILERKMEEDLAVKAATARWRRISDPADQKSLARVVRFLQGRGFDAGLANRTACRTRPRGEDE